jgi:hypothetical protein
MIPFPFQEGQFGLVIVPTWTYYETVISQLPWAYWRMGDTYTDVAYDGTGNERHAAYIASPTHGQTTLDPTSNDEATLFNGSTQYGKKDYEVGMHSVNWTVTVICKPAPTIGSVVARREGSFSANKWNWAVRPSGANGVISNTVDASNEYEPLVGTEPIPPEFPSSQMDSSDALYSSVSLLLNCNGANGGIVFTDVSPSPKTVGVISTTTSTVQAKYGSASALFNGSTSQLTAPNGSAFQYAGDFCVEMWVWPKSTVYSTFMALYDCRASNGSATGFAVYSDSGTLIFYTNGANRILSKPFALRWGLWNHIAVSRKGSNVYLWVNGECAGTYSTAANFSDGNCVIGSGWDAAGLFYDGYIDDIRITNGASRYIDTVPSRHVAMSYQQLGSTFGIVKIYKNGLLKVNVLTSIGMAATSTCPMYLSSDANQLTGAPYEQMPGTVDEVAYWTRTLTATEIKAQAQALGYTTTEPTWSEVVATARGQWSLRAVGSYAGALIDVRRDSDGAARTISVSADELDTTDLLSWAGSASVYVSKWYDQSGNGYHLTQATNANQPRIVNAGSLETLNGFPVIKILTGTSLTESTGVIADTDSFCCLLASDTSYFCRGKDGFGGWNIVPEAIVIFPATQYGPFFTYTLGTMQLRGCQLAAGRPNNFVQSANGAQCDLPSGAGTNYLLGYLRASTVGFTVGEAFNGTTYPGAVAEFFVWNTAISQAKTAAIWDNIKTRFGL